VARNHAGADTEGGRLWGDCAVAEEGAYTLGTHRVLADAMAPVIASVRKSVATPLGMSAPESPYLAPELRGMTCSQATERHRESCEAVSCTAMDIHACGREQRSYACALLMLPFPHHICTVSCVPRSCQR
jgi:hypothetical protein